MSFFLFIIINILAILWLYLSFYFFSLDNWELFYSEGYNIFFESIFFIGLLLFWFFIWRFFPFLYNVRNSLVENNKIKFVKKEKQKIGENDDLKVIDWIGPKIEMLLKLNNIDDLGKLSETWYDELKWILNRAWDNFKIINPKSWPYQSELASSKQWGKLREYQDFLIWGVDPDEQKK
jgi:hypothetical protein